MIFFLILKIKYIRYICKQLDVKYNLLLYFPECKVWFTIVNF